MNVLKQSFKVLLEIQIVSALIWGAVIIGCSYVSSETDISSIATILIAGAGFHVLLMAFNTEKNAKSKKLRKEAY